MSVILYEQVRQKFLEIVGLSLPRILGLCDRDAESQTYGCFDRNYWHYRFLDFPNVRFQEATLILVLIDSARIIKNFYCNERVRSLAVGAINFAFSHQNRDGSFNEAYPFERSFVATSFVGVALLKSILLLKMNHWETSILKLGHWLSKHNNPEVSNQMAGAANALYLAYMATDNKDYLRASHDKIVLLKQYKGNNLFLPEYGGLDIGYLSIALSHLVILWKNSKNDEVYEIANDAATCIESHLDDYGRFDWSNMSRKTQYVYPYGFAVLEKFNVLEKLLNGLKKNLILNPSWMDDRFCIPFTLDYLMTVLELEKYHAD